MWRIERKKGLYKIENLKSALDKLGIKLADIEHYKLIDELRLINNAIKHSGKADLQLQKYGWEVNDKFENLEKKGSLFTEFVPKYLIEVMKHLDGVTKKS